MGSPPVAAGILSQVSACYEIIHGQVQRVRLCPLSNVTGHHTQIGASECDEHCQCGLQMVGVNGLIGRLHVGTLPEKPAG